MNGILRVSLGAEELVCFLEGHDKADPFSIEAHDHLEGGAGHTHGLGAQYVLHERHGMAKACHVLETMHYTVKKVSVVVTRILPRPCCRHGLGGPPLS